MGVDDAECEVRFELGFGEHVYLFVAAVAQFHVELVDGVVVQFGVDARVVAVTDVQADAHVLRDAGDDALQTLPDDGVVVRRRGEGRFVDLDVLCARLDQFLYLLVDEVREVVREVGLGVVHLVERPRRERVRPRDGHLHRLLGGLARELELVDEPRFVVLDLVDDRGLVEVVVAPDFHATVEVVAVDAVGEELDHLVSAHLAVHDRIQTGAFVFVGDTPGGVVVGLLQVVGVELRLVVFGEFVCTIQPLRLRVTADDSGEQEVVGRVVLGTELLAGVGVRARHASTSAGATASASADSLASNLFVGR